MIRQQVRGFTFRWLGGGLLATAIAGVYLVMEWRVIQMNWSREQYTMPLVMCGILLVGLAVASWGIFITVRPEHHPILRRLAAFGPADQVAADIDREAADPSALTIGQPLRSFRLAKDLNAPVLVTRSWVVQPLEEGLRLVRLDDVLAVRKIDQTDPFALLGGRSMKDGVEVLVKRGRDERFFLNRDDSHRLLIELLTRLPWVQGGFERWGDRVNEAERRQLSDAICQERDRLQIAGTESLPQLIDDKIRQAELRKHPR